MSEVLAYRGTPSGSNTTGITEVSSTNPLPVTTSGSSSSASTGGGNNTYSNVTGDFTATANSGAKTITLSSYASTTLSSVISTLNFANAVIKRVTSAGVVDVLPLTNIAFSANVLTLADMTANFAVGDTVAVFVPGPDKSFDETNDRNKVAEQLAPTYEDNVVQVAKVEQRFSYSYISTATTTTIKSGAGFLHTITITEAVASTIIVYNNTAGSGTIIASFVASAGVGTYHLNVSFDTGLTIVTAGASKLTVSYR